jgi:hypothetical protein
MGLGDARFSPRPAGIPWIRQLVFQVDGGYLTRAGDAADREPGLRRALHDRVARGDAFTAQYSNSYENLVAPARIFLRSIRGGGATTGTIP